MLDCHTAANDAPMITMEILPTPIGSAVFELTREYVWELTPGPNRRPVSVVSPTEAWLPVPTDGIGVCPICKATAGVTAETICSPVCEPFWLTSDAT